MIGTRVFADGEIVFIATVESPEFIGEGLYLLDHYPQPVAFWVTYDQEHDWFELVTPIGRKRHSAYSGDLFQRNCIGRLSAIWCSNDLHAGEVDNAKSD